MRQKINDILNKERSQTICESDIAAPQICIVPCLPDLARKSSHISQSILTAYQSKVPRAENWEDFWNDQIDGTNLYGAPFEISVFGAYPIMTAWRELKRCMKLAYNDNERIEETRVEIKNGFKYKTTDYKKYEKEKVLNGLKNFAKGFQHGFDTFITTHIDSPSAISPSDRFKVQRVIDFIQTVSWQNCFFQPILFKDNEEEIARKWHADGVNAGADYHAWCFILTDHKMFEPYFEETQRQEDLLRKEISILNGKSKIISTDEGIDNSIETENKSSSILKNLPDKSERFIDPDFLELVLKAEAIAMKPFEKFNTKIRCAAFCEMLYEKKYIINTKTRIQTISQFAKERYKMLIGASLTAAKNKKEDRSNHKNNRVGKMLPLKNCF